MKYKIGYLLFILILLCSLDAYGQGQIVRPKPRSQKKISRKSPIKLTVSSPDGYINGHGYVDIGLKNMWAINNVGANTPEEYGDYFAWGETSPKSDYSKENSKTYGRDLKIRGDSSYDAATANWGNRWCLPNESDCIELMNCKWTWGILNGVYGAKIEGPNGKSIFLPANSRKHGTKFFDKPGNTAYYLTTDPYIYYNKASLEDFSALYFCCFDNRPIHIQFIPGSRYDGFPVRPILNSTFFFIDNKFGIPSRKYLLSRK